MECYIDKSFQEIHDETKESIGRMSKKIITNHLKTRFLAKETICIEREDDVGAAIWE